MRSEDNKNLLYDYVKGLLPDNEKAEFEKQLANSVELQNDLKRVKQYYSLVKSSEQSEVPINFVDTVHQKIGVFNDLPDNGVSPEPFAAAQSRYVDGSFENRSVSADVQKEHKNTNRLKPRFKRWFSFEAAGVLATVAILVFIFIPNVNIPERAKNAMYNEPLLQDAEEKNKVTEQQPQETSKPISEVNVSKPVVAFDDKRVTDDEGSSVKANEEKKTVPQKSIIHSPAKGMIAKDQPASPRPSAPLSLSGSSIGLATNEDRADRAVSGGDLKERSLQALPAPAAVTSGRLSDETQSHEPVRIIMRAAEVMKPELNEAPSSIQPETKILRSRSADRINKKTLNAQIAESEYAVKRSADATITVGEEIDKREIESVLSEYGIVWKCVYQEGKKLCYSLNGSGKSIKSIVRKLEDKGFTINKIPDLSNDSLTAQLEINY